MNPAFAQWYAEWLDKNDYFSSGLFDIWEYDNFFGVPRVNDTATGSGTKWTFTSSSCEADFLNNGTNQSCTDSAVEAAYEAGEVAGVTARRAVEPDMIISGNTDSTTSSTHNSSAPPLSAPLLTGQLDGAHMECVSITGTLKYFGENFTTMMNDYLGEPAHLRGAKLQEMGACIASGDYAAFRFSLGTALMGDGFLAVSINGNYNTAGVAWFDEYNVNLGTASQVAATSASSVYQAGVQAGNYQNSGVWRRDFQNGIALVNSTTSAKTITLGGTFHKLVGTQDSAINNGDAVTSVTINAEDGLVLCKSACANYPRTSSR
jgi:hypothetical protein